MVCVGVATIFRIFVLNVFALREIIWPYLETLVCGVFTHNCEPDETNVL